MNMPVDVRATFNVEGKIRPDYIRLKDDAQTLHTYKIDHVEFTKEEHFAGIHSILFVCYISVEEIRQQVRLKYMIDNHKWIFIQ
jgi:hypothetical protein